MTTTSLNWYSESHPKGHRSVIVLRTSHQRFSSCQCCPSWGLAGEPELQDSDHKPFPRKRAATLIATFEWAQIFLSLSTVWRLVGGTASSNLADVCVRATEEPALLWQCFAWKGKCIFRSINQFVKSTKKLIGNLKFRYNSIISPH